MVTIPGKVGTVPATIVLKRKYKLQIGEHIKFRTEPLWKDGIIERLHHNDDGKVSWIQVVKM